MRSLAVFVLLVATACGGGPRAEFTVDGDYLALVGDDGPEPIYVKGVNLGVGIPGTYPGQLALDRETYLRWFERMKEAGFNAVRIYTLHHPEFYRSVYEFNNFRPHDPLYIIHGTWLDEDNPTGGLDVYDLTDSFDSAIEEVIDAVHGNAEIDHRLGKGFGTYDVDISRWVMGYIIGREMYGSEAITGNLLHPEITGYEGEYLRIEDVTATEAWVTARLDHALTYEAKRYNVLRPVALSSWPTLDPLYHPSETHGVDLSRGLETGAGEDDAQIDVTQIEAVKDFPGLFVSYHAYPYYPDFIYRDPEYATATDDEGPNNYVGYLRALKEHYQGIPLVISEYGIPSSWGNAHISDVAGMHHGGHDEVTQGEMLARLTRNVYDTGCAGGAVFSWMDEWWKRTWIVAHRTFPLDRYPFWFDATSPEESYGLIAFDIAPPSFDRWPEVTGAGRVTALRADADASFFHLEIDLAAPLGSTEQLVIGVDTYRDDLGESVLPDGAVTPIRSEIAVVIGGDLTAQVHVTEAYDRYGYFHGQMTGAQVGKSVATDGAPWRPWQWITTGPAVSDDGSMMFPQIDHNQGALRVRRRDDPPSSLDAVILGDTVSIKIPWNLLNVADPSELRVVHDDLDTEYRFEAEETDGFRIAVSLGADLVTTGRMIWEPWDEAPPTTEREKPAMAAMEAVLAEIPDTP